MEHLSLVSKICTELDNHLGLNDKDLGKTCSKQKANNFRLQQQQQLQGSNIFLLSIVAEFIIDLSEKHTTFESFKTVLIENGAEFPDSFVTNLLRIIQLMKPSSSGAHHQSTFISNSDPNADRLANKFPGLAIPNSAQDELKPLEEKPADDKKDIKSKTMTTVADDMLAELESFAPKSSNKTDDLNVKVAIDEKHERKRSRTPTDLDRNDRKHRSRSRDKRTDRKRRSRSPDDHRRRSRSRERRRDRSNSRDRHRQQQHRDSRRRRSNSRERSRSRGRDRNRSRSRDRTTRRGSHSRTGRDERDNRTKPNRNRRSATPLPDDPEPGNIYSGRVTNIVPFGCFVQMAGLRRPKEGLVHISQLRSEGRVTDVTEVVNRGQNVHVKVMSVTGQKVSLSMKEVDQSSGRDLNPSSHAHLRADSDVRDRNPDRPTGTGGTSMLHLQGTLDGEEDQTRKRVTRISSPERWEIKQMISSGVIDRSELPDFDDETGLLPKDEDDEADIEIEIVEEEPPFLQGHGRALNDLSPVRIVKNPDGSLAQAAMMQSALAKERREQKMLQREQEMDTIPTSLNKNWIDPLPDGKLLLHYELGFLGLRCFNIEDSRALAANVRGIGMTPQEVPEWKKHVIGGKKSSFGKKTDLTLIEQRRSLPIYKLRDDLIKVRYKL